MELTARRCPRYWPAGIPICNASIPLPPIGGGDAHASVRVFGPLGGTIGTYREVFLTLSTHVLAESLDEAALLEAIRKAGLTCPVTCGVKATGFDFRAVDGEVLRLPGDSVDASPTLELRVHAPRAGKMHLLRDGLVVQEGEGTQLVCREPHPGIYRVEVLTEAGRAVAVLIHDESQR
jgi:hypothetical protein